jgi:TolA-binding protein
MKLLVWFTLVGTIVGIGYAFTRWRRRWVERQEEAEARMASLIAQVTPAGPPRISATAPVQAPAPQERLLLDAAAKAGEAGEPALAIQLYAKLISRYPQSSFVAQARAAVDAQKKKLAKP